MNMRSTGRNNDAAAQNNPSPDVARFFREALRREYEKLNAAGDGLRPAQRRAEAVKAAMRRVDCQFSKDHKGNWVADPIGEYIDREQLDHASTSRR